MNILPDATHKVAGFSNADQATPAGALTSHPVSYQWLWPILDTHIAACDLLWKVGHKSPFLAEIQRRTGLNKRVFKLLSDAQDPKALQNIWTERLPDYHYTMLVGRLVLESPLRPLFEEMATSETLSEGEISAAIDTSIAYVREAAPLLERWFIGEYDAHATSPLPDAPEKRTILAGWATRRAQLEVLFKDAGAEIDALIERFLSGMGPPPPPLPPPLSSPPTPLSAPSELLPVSSPPAAKEVKSKPSRPWSLYAFAFSQNELEVVRRLLALMPRFGVICPLERFYLAFRALNGFRFPDALKAERQRFEIALPDNLLRFTLLQALILLQTLHVTLHLLHLIGKKKRPKWWVQAIGDAAEHAGVDEELRVERVQAYQFLNNPAARNRVRQLTDNMSHRFDKFVDRIFPASPGIVCGRAEIMNFRKLR